jgi:hypothetical protein
MFAGNRFGEASNFVWVAVVGAAIVNVKIGILAGRMRVVDER